MSNELTKIGNVIIAETEEQKQKVCKYLSSKGTIPATNDLYYTEDDKGNITGAFGIEVKVCVEPLQAEHKFAFRELADKAIKIIENSGVPKYHFFTSNERLVELSKRKYGCIQLNNKLTELLKLLKI